MATTRERRWGLLIFDADGPRLVKYASQKAAGRAFDSMKNTTKVQLRFLTVPASGIPEWVETTWT